MTDKKPANPLSMLGQIASAVGGTVGDIVREVRQDLKDMTPPEPKKAGQGASTIPTFPQGSSGLAHIDLGGDAPSFTEDDVPSEAPTGKTVNPWEDTKTAGKMCVDACFLATNDSDIERYITALDKEYDKPFTLAVLAGDAGSTDMQAAICAAVNADPRIFGALGFGPRHLQDDLEAMDEALTNLLNTHPKLLAIGPIGLDEPYAPYTLGEQVEQMVRQLEIAADFGLPVILTHNKSLPHMKAVLEGLETLPTLIWANPLETEDDMALVRKLDAYVLVRPEITYDEHRLARENLRRFLPERWLLASGSSLLSPKPRSGHTNGPEGLSHTLKHFAEMHKQTPNDLRQTLNTNARRVFTGN